MSPKHKKHKPRGCVTGVRSVQTGSEKWIVVQKDNETIWERSISAYSTKFYTVIRSLHDDAGPLGV